MDDALDRAAREAPIRALLGAAQLRDAATATLELYGDEVCGYLHAVARDDDLAGEGFAGFCEALWRGLAGFRWESSLRTWCYALARNALWRQRQRGPRGKREVPLEDDALHGLAVQIRTATLQYLRTEVKDGFRQLRDELTVEDLELLVLRVDRKLSWRDVARAVPADGATLEQRAAALRKRFERIKGRLRELAAARGLLAQDL
ncbi:MAG: hypothetical protein R3B06_21930 [Kofleriaceae bacterium]